MDSADQPGLLPATVGRLPIPSSIPRPPGATAAGPSALAEPPARPALPEKVLTLPASQRAQLYRHPVRALLSVPVGPTRRSVLDRVPAFLRHSLTVQLAATVLLTLLSVQFIAQSFSIPSLSMAQTLRIGDRILVDKISLQMVDVHRGQIVVFRSAGTVYATREANAPKYLIKRVVAVAGDVVSCCSTGSTVTVNGVDLHEPYVLALGAEAHRTFGPVVVPPGEVFVMGDNRGNSLDSRYVGPIPSSALVGIARLKFWPLTELSAL